MGEDILDVFLAEEFMCQFVNFCEFCDDGEISGIERVGESSLQKEAVVDVDGRNCLKIFVVR